MALPPSFNRHSYSLPNISDSQLQMSNFLENMISPPNCPKKRSKEIIRNAPAFPNFLVVLNKRSGGWQAVGLERAFVRLVGRTNVLDITEINDIAHLKEQLSHLINRKDVKVIAGCGDGTMSSIFSLLDLLEIPAPLAPLALGTGNELSGILGWGRAYVGESIEDFLDNVDTGRVTNFDRWSVTFKDIPRRLRLQPRTMSSSWSPSSLIDSVTSLTTSLTSSLLSPSEPQLPDSPPEDCPALRRSSEEVSSTEEGGISRTENMLCFFSIGFDAEIALKFHYLRESNPSLCANRELNKLYHTVWGAKMLFWGANKIAQYIELEVDGKIVDVPPTIGCLQFFNIHSSGSGVDYFGLSQKGNSSDLLTEYSQPSVSDGLLEVIGTEDIVHYLQISTYTHGRRLAQGSEIRIRMMGNRPLPVQMDGNPWEQEPCEVIISRKDQLKLVLGNRPDEYRGI